MTTPNAQHEIAKLTRMATDPQFTVAERAAALLIAHQRRDVGSCLCGWDELGKSHAAHQADELARAGLLAAADHHARTGEVCPVSRALFDEDPAAYEPYGHQDRTGEAACQRCGMKLTDCEACGKPAMCGDAWCPECAPDDARLAGETEGPA